MSGAAVLDPAAMFADLAIGISAICGGPFFAGRVFDQTEVEHDDGGDVIPGTGVPRERECQIQIDAADYAMRQEKGWVEGTMRCIILAASLQGPLDTDAVVTVDAGAHAGKTWQVSRIGRDTLGAHWIGKAVEA